MQSMVRGRVSHYRVSHLLRFYCPPSNFDEVLEKKVAGLVVARGEVYAHGREVCL